MVHRVVVGAGVMYVASHLVLFYRHWYVTNQPHCYPNAINQVSLSLSLHYYLVYMLL
jgi:hypothetical protein